MLHALVLAKITRARKRGEARRVTGPYRTPNSDVVDPYSVLMRLMSCDNEMLGMKARLARHLCLCVCPNWILSLPTGP